MSVAKNLLFIENQELRPAFTVTTTALSADSNGTGIDRTGFETVGVGLAVGAATGSPTARSVVIELQHSTDNTTFVDLTDRDGNVVTTDGLTADSTNTYLRVDLSAARQYIRAVAKPNFTGGTSPAIPFVCMLLLADRQRNELFDAETQYTQTFTP